jgi:hypothetical protein
MILALPRSRRNLRFVSDTVPATIIVRVQCSERFGACVIDDMDHRTYTRMLCCLVIGTFDFAATVIRWLRSACCSEFERVCESASGYHTGRQSCGHIRKAMIEMLQLGWIHKFVVIVLPYIYIYCMPC